MYVTLCQYVLVNSEDKPAGLCLTYEVFVSLFQLYKDYVLLQKAEGHGTKPLLSTEQINHTAELPWMYAWH